ncbi:RNA polymerase sigma factor [Streptomyces sp. NPDC053499]|uniref:RNA polymerase sigma factor n=1 Tax=Streptomyces sp. NPDC053499 TaxID=3365707 RepID=UPI0037D6FD26
MTDRGPSPRPQADDAELLARVHRPSTPAERTDALEAIADRHYQDVLLYLTRRVRDADVAMELTQQTFADAIAVLLSDDAEAQPRADRLGAWLTGIAGNRLRRHFTNRSRLAERSRSLGQDESMDDHPLEDPDRPRPADDPVRLFQARRVIGEVAATLSPQDRSLYQWYFQEQLTPAEIVTRMAAVSGARAGTAKSPADGGTGSTEAAPTKTEGRLRRRVPSPKTINNRATALKTVLAEGFHAYLLVQNDRTLCALLDGIVAAHPPGFSAPLRDHVVKHTYNCAQCGRCACCRRCGVRKPERITSGCTASADCRACEICRRESTALKAGWAPALVLALYLRPVRDAISDVIDGTAPVGHDAGHRDGPPDRPRPRGRRGRILAGAAAAVLVGAAGGAAGHLLAGPADERGPASGAGGTRTVTVVPVGAQGAPRPGYTVESEPGSSVQSCSASAFAVDRDIVSCSPNALTAQACWIETDRTKVLCGSPKGKRLREYRSSSALPRTAPKPRDQVVPWAVELTDGRLCTPRWGGPPATLPDDLTHRYTCPASDGSPAGLLVEDGDAPLLDKTSPRWKVRVVERADDSAGFSRPRLRQVAAVYFAGRP